MCISRWGLGVAGEDEDGDLDYGTIVNTRACEVEVGRAIDLVADSREAGVDLGCEVAVG